MWVDYAQDFSWLAAFQFDIQGLRLIQHFLIRIYPPQVCQNWTVRKVVCYKAIL